MTEDPFKYAELQFYSWGHGLRGKTATINDLIYLIKRKLADPSPDLANINSKLDTIQEISKEIAVIPSPFDLESVSVNALISERIKRQETTIISQNVKIETSLDPSEPKVTANPVWLGRIFSILIDNAIEAMADSVNKMIKISTHVDESGVVISIEDIGKGIDKSIMEGLFQKPVKLSGVRGKGLYIVHLAVELYGGTVRVTTTTPNGTTIEVRLPLVKE